MRVLSGMLTGFSLLLTLVLSPQARAQDQEPRLALVIGNANYKVAPIATPVSDAGLVAQTLQEAGFDVTGAADLDQDALRRALRDFVAKVQQAGPNAVVFVYLSGRGLQYAGQNYFVPVDAVVQRETDVPLVNVRLTDYTQALAAMPAKARIFVFDIARRLHFATEGDPFASGLAIVDAEPGSLYAFNAAPGTIAPGELGPYGFYAEALVEMIREGASLDQVFTDTRLRVNALSNGAMVPWDIARIEAPISFFTREASAPPLPDVASQENQPLTGLPAAEAYVLVVERDTLAGYGDFLAAYPRDPLALRVRALLAVRREALTWFSAVEANTPQAYWTYMRRYPHGPHFVDARRRLSTLAAALDPPPRFDPYDFQGLPPPPEDEDMIIERPVLIFDDPSFPPPPAPPISILPAQPVEFEHLPPPPLARPGFLPVPAPIPLQFSKPFTKPGAAIPPKVSESQGGTPPQGQPSGTPGKPVLPEKPATTLHKPRGPTHEVKRTTPSGKPVKPEAKPKQRVKLKKNVKPEVIKPHRPTKGAKPSKPGPESAKPKAASKRASGPGTAITASKPAHGAKQSRKPKQHDSSKGHKPPQ
jgi:uncharacterized caspase-like protein